MIIYTAIFGNYEELKEPLIVTPEWDYICFTDQPLKSNVWKIVNQSAENPLKEARHIKIRCAPPDKSIWVDASFTINIDLNEFWANNFQSPFTVSPHPWRKNIGHEIEACIKNKRANIAGLIRQHKQYRVLKLVSMPVISSGILLRENTEEVKAFCELWWSQIELSTRDQIGFAYAESKMPIVKRMNIIDYRTSKDFIFKTHFNRR